MAINKHVLTWAQTKNLPIKEDAAVLVRQGLVITCSLMPGQGLTVHLPISPERWNPDLKKQLKFALRGQGRLFFVKGRIQVTIRATGDKRTQQCIENVTDALVSTLSPLGIITPDACQFCGGNGCDDIAVKDAVAKPAHKSCLLEQADRIMMEVEKNELSGNYLLGVIFALVGGLIGCLPSALTIYFLERVYALLYALIPITAYFGYKLGGGKMSGAVPFIVSIVAVICTGVLELCYNYYLFVDYFGRMLALGEFFEILTDPEVLPEVIRESAMSFVFCAIGIAISWNYIRSTNRHKLQRAMEYRRSSEQAVASEAARSGSERQHPEP